MNKIAFIFPGQGSQVVGMGKDLYQEYEAAKKVYDIADETLGYKISEICFEGPDDVLKQTESVDGSWSTSSIVQRLFVCCF